MICTQLICAPKVGKTFGAQNFYRKKVREKYSSKKNHTAGRLAENLSAPFFGMKKGSPVRAPFCWRREEDSNLRTSHPRHTISNRAP